MKIWDDRGLSTLRPFKPRGALLGKDFVTFFKMMRRGKGGPSRGQTTAENFC